MGDGTRGPNRRSVLRATGAAFGVGGLLAASGPAAAGDLCLAQDTTVSENCPPTGFDGPVVRKGAEAFEACTAEDIQYYLVADSDNAGYVGRWALTFC